MNRSCRSPLVNHARALAHKPEGEPDGRVPQARHRSGHRPSTIQGSPLSPAPASGPAVPRSDDVVARRQNVSESIGDAELSVGVQTYKEIAMTKNPVSITQSESIVEQKPSPASPPEADIRKDTLREKEPDGMVYMHGYPVPSFLKSHKSDQVPTGGFHGSDDLPKGSFHGGDHVPAGSFHNC